MSKLAVAMATTVAPTSLASGPKPTCEPFATINPQHDGIYWRFAPMRIVGSNGFKAAAFIHDKKVISATKNIGWCSGWPVDRFTRFVEQRGWQIIRDDDGEGAGERPRPE